LVKKEIGDINVRTYWQKTKYKDLEKAKS